MENKFKKTKPHAACSTLQACILESGRIFKKEALIRLGKQCADAYYTVYGKRPSKIEVVENNRILFVAIYPKKFKKVVHNLIDATK